MANKEHLLLWVEDLESGKHAQTYGAMARTHSKPPSYCCLGRVCEVAIENDVDIVRTNSATGIRYDNHRGSYVPYKVASWLGTTSGALVRYAALNDRGKTFAEIAAQIRKDYNL